MLKRTPFYRKILVGDDNIMAQVAPPGFFPSDWGKVGGGRASDWGGGKCPMPLPWCHHCWYTCIGLDVDWEVQCQHRRHVKVVTFGGSGGIHSMESIVELGLYTIFALPGSSGWQNSPTRTTQLKTRLDAAVAMRVYSISAGQTLH